MPESPWVQLPLAGLRVVEWGEGVAPAFAGRWLAAFGAEVVTVEPPEGHWARRYGPSGGTWEQGEAPLSTYLFAGKQSVSLDASTAPGRAMLQRLLGDGDLFVHDRAPDALAHAGLDAGGLRERQPALVEVALLPFGSSGPYAGFQASPITLLALGGYQFLTGEPGRPPLMLPGFQAEYLTALYGVSAALAALHRATHDGAGAAVEISIMEALASLHQFTISQYLSQGTIRSRHGNRWENLYPITMLPCRDGLLAFSLPSQDMWERMCAMLGRPDLLDDPRFLTPMLRRQHADDVDAILLEWLRERDMDPTFTMAQEHWRLPINRFYELDEVLRDPQYLERGYWVRAEGDESGLLQPGMPLRRDRLPWRIGRAPRAGEHTQALAGGWTQRQPLVSSRPAPDGMLARRSSAAGGRDAPLPLRGVRVLDFTRVWSGPLCTRILCDLGADVIKIDSPLVRALPAAAAARAGSGTGPQRPMLSQNKLARNKRSLCIDLRLPAGVELVKRLVAKADVLVENFSARVMPQFGLGYETLRTLNPGLIMLGMPGYGATGPYKNYLGYGPSSEAMTGVTALLGYPGEEPLNSAIAYPDAVAGLTGAAAVLTALSQRERTGAGTFLDLSQLEPTSAMIGEYFIEYQMTGRRPPRAGNRHPYWAPQGTYRCLGDDDWISLSVRSDEEWLRFCAAIGITPRAEWATAAGRRSQIGALDAEIERWTASRSKFGAMSTLQAAGIAAGAVLNAKELYEDPQLAARGFFIEALAPEGGSYPMPGTPITVDGERRADWRAAPYPGEHNRTVLQELLGMTATEVAALEAEGVLAGAAAVV